MKPKPVYTHILLMLLFASLVAACDRSRVFEENRAIEKGIWNNTVKVPFEATIADTNLAYNVYLNVRNSLDYPYSNLYLFLETRFPDGRIARDTIDCMLADYDGRWLGSGMGSLRYNRYLFQQGVRFPEKGNYRFELEQAMRLNDLTGIHDIGIRIEKETSR